jgi:phosphomannomutase
MKTVANAGSEALLQRALAWRDADPDPQTRSQLDGLIDQVSGTTAVSGDTDPAMAASALRACFEPPLTFGTAGLRGLAGPGPAHMNALLIQRVTAVIADVLIAEVPDAARRGVVIGYDARHGSCELAEAAARTIASMGIGVHTFDGYAPTPLAAFATLELEAAAGLVLTASHNPPAYLGYKVYWSNAAQIVSPLDKRIDRALAALPLDAAIPGESVEAPYWQVHGNALWDRYLSAIARPGRDTSHRERLKIAYSAMHGVGGELVKAALANQDGIELHEVAEQAEPDGDFPTVNFPNPEEPGALERLTERAAEVGADLALATDPDADRLAVAIPDAQGQWQVLMGDQTGALLADYLLATREEANGGAQGVERARPGFVVNTVVSSRLLGRIAAHYGVGFEQTLTGFKWIWHRALQREAAGEAFIFGYEDAIGYCPTRRVRDKDGIATAVVMAELTRATRAAGMTLHERLEGLYDRFGLAVTRQVSLKLEGDDALARMTSQLTRLRENPPDRLAGLRVDRVHDYIAAERFCPGKTGGREPIALPNTDLIQLELGPCLLSIRPSGTEPKLKIYLEYLGAAGEACKAREAEEAHQQIAALAKAVESLLVGG